MASELHLGDSNWKFFKVGYPADTPTDMNLLLRVSVTHRPALARSILGRWKERSSDETSVLASCTRNIQTDQRNQKHILTHWHTVQKWKQRRKTSFTRNPPEKEREINKRGKKYKQILNKNEFRTKAEPSFVYLSGFAFLSVVFIVFCLAFVLFLRLGRGIGW